MEKRLQLFLVPFAGGNANSFNKLISCLDNYVEAITVEYPGRGTRYGEGYINDYNTFLEDVAAYINNRRNLNLPYILLGYSLGSALIYDLIRLNKIDKEPELLILCARGFVAHRVESQRYTFLGEDEFIEKVRCLGGVDERILSNKRFFNLYMEPLKNDYQIWSQYTYIELNNKLSCDILTFFCNTDTPRELVYDWKQITTGNVSYYEFGNNHFFINEHYQEMADIINKKMMF